MGKLNELLKGFRTIIVAWSGVGLVVVLDYLLLFVSNFFTSFVDFGADAIKGAVTTAIIVTLKQIATDVIPKLRGELRK